MLDRMTSGAASRLTRGALWAGLAGAAWLGWAAPPPQTAEGTRQMAALLQETAARVDLAVIPYVVNDRRADFLARSLDQPRPLSEQLSFRFRYATELVHAGRSDAALAAIADLRRDAETISPQNWQKAGPMLLLLEAAALLRKGEQDNCSMANTAQSCLLPIRGEGIHRRTEGSTGAIRALQEVLALEPENLRARWLLNIAHMTLGGYPDRVPPELLIPPSVFASEHPLPRFPNVADQAGLDIHGLSGGAILDDFDGDGRLDLMVSAIGFDDQLRFLHNRGDGRFEDRTGASGLAGETGGLNLLQADYDNDGRVDALVLRGAWLGTEGRFPLSLLRNEGGGRFADVTRAAGLLRFAPTQTATWLDYDSDGWLDLFVGNESTPGAVHPCQLFHNERNGTFTERAAAAGVEVKAFVKGVVSGDYDGDGRPDLYVSVGGGDNLLFHNDGPGADPAGWRFTEVGRAAGVTAPQASFAAFFFDYDNDGRLDLYVAGYGANAEDVAADYLGLPTAGERPRLYHNRGDGTFEDVTRAARLDRVMPGMGLNFGDLDNDGWLDFYVGTGNPDLTTLVPNRMFRNDGGKAFQDVTTAGDFGHLQKGHAVCFGDYDEDGDQDIFAELGGAYTADTAHSALFANPGNANAWLRLTLEGVRSNRGAVGARIKVTADGPEGRRVVHRTVGSGGSFGASPLRQEIGLGPARRILDVEVSWPSGQTQRFAGLALRRRYHLREGSPEARKD
jgi:ASPIC/UnbV protein/VCBS repeat protein